MIPTLTIVEHVQTGAVSRLVVSVPDTPAEVFSAIAGDALDEGGDAIVTVGWQVSLESIPAAWDESGAVTGTVQPSLPSPQAQRDEARALIEHALSGRWSQAPEITPPGTEL